LDPTTYRDTMDPEIAVHEPTSNHQFLKREAPETDLHSFAREQDLLEIRAKVSSSKSHG